MIGKVKWFDSKKGYGFILNEEGREIFVHYTGIVAEGFKATKKLKIDTFFGRRNTPAGIAIAFLALNGITLGFDAVKCFNILNEYDYVDIKDAEHAVRFVGQNGDLVLYVMPYAFVGGWKEVK